MTTADEVAEQMEAEKTLTRRHPCKPQLGCATTRELLTEIVTRLEVRVAIGAEPRYLTNIAWMRDLLGHGTDEVLNYRTVDS